MAFAIKRMMNCVPCVSLVGSQSWHPRSPWRVTVHAVQLVASNKRNIQALEPFAQVIIQRTNQTRQAQLYLHIFFLINTILLAFFINFTVEHRFLCVRWRTCLLWLFPVWTTLPAMAVFWPGHGASFFLSIHYLTEADDLYLNSPTNLRGCNGSPYSADRASHSRQYKVRINDQCLLCELFISSEIQWRLEHFEHKFNVKLNTKYVKDFILKCLFV